MSEGDVGGAVDSGGGGAPQAPAGAYVAEEPKQAMPPNMGERDRDEPGDSKPRAAPKPKEDAEKAAKAEAEVLKALKRKIKHRGQEVELDAESAFLRNSDDYEHEFTGPGGKPIKMRWNEIERSIPLVVGAQGKMQQAIEAQRRFNERVELAKRDDESRLSFLTSELGVEDPDQWVTQLALKKYEEDQQLLQLQQQDPLRYHRIMEQRAQKKFERRAMLEQQAQQRAQQEQQQQAQVRQEQERYQGAFRELGVPWNTETRDLGSRILKQYREAGVQLDARQIADAVRSEYRNARKAELLGMEPSELAQLLGDDWRAKMRAWEIEQMKEQKREARAVEAPKPKPANDNSEQISEAEFKRRMRLGTL